MAYFAVAGVLLLAAVLLLSSPTSSHALADDGLGAVHPPYKGLDSCAPVDLPPDQPARGAGAGGGRGRILDITHPYKPDTPALDSDAGVGPVVRQVMSMANGSLYNLSEMKMVVHTGTHVDAPGHMYQEYFAAQFDVDTLDLYVLNGPALLVDVPRDMNITAEAMASLHIPRGITRVLFRTLNTDRKLMWKKEGDTSYIGFTEDGAQWLVDNTDIKLIGTDYLSVAAYDHLISAHLVLLKSREIILVEALKLDDVKPGIYTLHCLPLRLIGAEGSPIRCILVE